MVSLSLTDPAVQSYIFYSAVLCFKVLAVSVLTARARFLKNVFANEEDTKLTKGKVKLDDQDVERVRRAHRNDLENIPIFWILGVLYLTTGPALGLAKSLFRWFTLGRVAHTIVYAVKPLPQPARGIAFGIPFAINVYMGISVILYYIGSI